MEVISLGVVPDELIDEDFEEKVRAWALKEVEDTPFTTGYPHKPQPSAVCLREAQTGPEDKPYSVVVADLMCDWEGYEGLPVVFHNLHALDSILHAT